MFKQQLLILVVMQLQEPKQEHHLTMHQLRLRVQNGLIQPLMLLITSIGQTIHQVHYQATIQQATNGHIPN
jgi:hypothetical protein